MTIQRNYIYYFWVRISFILTIPVAIVSVLTMIHSPVLGWFDYLMCLIGTAAPVYFYGELMKFKCGYTEIVTKTNHLFKCRVSGTDEIFFLQADEEEEAETYFAHVLPNKQVFIEESDIKMVKFDMKVDHALPEIGEIRHTVSL